MTSLTNKWALPVLVLLTISSCNPVVRSGGIACAKGVIGENALVRTDEPQKRFMVVRTKVSVESLRPIIEAIDKCLVDHQWKGQWSLSVFSQRNLAGYKDEPFIIPFHKDDVWAKGYLGEFDRATGLLTLHPLTQPEMIEILSPVAE